MFEKSIALQAVVDQADKVAKAPAWLKVQQAETLARRVLAWADDIERRLAALEGNHASDR